MTVEHAGWLWLFNYPFTLIVDSIAYVPYFMLLNTRNILFIQFTASVTFLPDFSRNVIGKATGLDEFTAPAALTILFLCICLILVTFVLNEDDCSQIGIYKDINYQSRSDWLVEW